MFNKGNKMNSCNCNHHSDGSLFDPECPMHPPTLTEREIRKLKQRVFILEDDCDHKGLFLQEMVALVLCGDHNARVNLSPGRNDLSRAMEEIVRLRALDISNQHQS